MKNFKSLQFIIFFGVVLFLIPLTITSSFAAISYQWHTFYGTSTSSLCHAPQIQHDSSGNIYIIANCKAEILGGDGNNTNVNPIVGWQFGSRELVVIKLNGNGNYLWHTFVPGVSANGIVVNSDGVYVLSTASFPVTTPSPLRAHSLGSDMVLTKLNASGVYQWHTYIGGNGADIAYDMKADSSGNLYIVGSSTASWGSPIELYQAGSSPAGVIVKISSSGVISWNTFINHTSQSSYFTVDVSPSGDIYAGGQVKGAKWGDPINYTAGQYGVVAKYNTGGTRQWHTYLGIGADANFVRAIRLGSGGVLYLTVQSNATWNGPTNQTPLRTYTSGEEDALVKLDSNGNYIWHTFLGYSSGINKDIPTLTIDGDNNVYVTGLEVSILGGEAKNVQPLKPFNQITSSKGIVKYNANGIYQWHTYHGSYADDYMGLSYWNEELIFGGTSYADWDANDTVPESTPRHVFSGSNRNITLTKFYDQSEVRVKVSGTGTGTVTSSPSGLNIGYPGQTSDSLFTDLGQNVVITAQAGSGYAVFFNDTCTDMGGTLVGENTSTATCTLSAKLVKNLSVEFKTAEYTLTVTKSGTGTGTVSAGSGCSLTWVGHTGTCKVPYNTTITLTATPDTDKTFTGFSSGTGSASVCDGVTGTCTFQLQLNSSVTANFSSGSSTQRVVTVYLTGDLDGKQRAMFEYYYGGGGGGCAYAMYGPNSVSCYINEGQTANLYVMNDSQAIRFTGFTGDITSTNQSVSINVDGNKVIYANFENKQRVVTVYLTGDLDGKQRAMFEYYYGGGGGGCAYVMYGPNSVSCYINDGQSANLYVMNDSQAIRFTGFTGDITSTNQSVSINVDGNKVIYANFENKQRVVTVYLTGDLDGKQRAMFEYYYGGGGGGCAYVVYGPNSISCYINEGQTANLYVMNDSQAIRFTGFTGDVTSTDTSVSINVDGDKLIYANFSYYCIKNISPTYKEFNNVGDTSTIRVDTFSESCNWTITSASAWITIDSSGSESGSKTVSFTVANNGTSTPRTGTITISDGFVNKTFTIYQLDRNNGGLSYQWHRLDGGLSTYVYKPVSTMDSEGNIYVLANSNSFNSGNNGLNNTSPIVDASTNRKMVVMKYNKDGVYQWHTFVPGDAVDSKMIAVSENGIYTVATANGSIGTPIRAYTGNADMVITKLDLDGAYQWHTYLGGTGNDYPGSIAVDSSDNVYVVGSSSASWGSPLVDRVSGSFSAGLLAKLNSSGVLQWHTFVNHTAGSSFSNIVVEASGNVYVVGSTSGQWGTPINYKTGQSSIVAKYNASGTKQWHTYFGSSSSGSYSIALDSSSNIYVLTNTFSSWTGPNNEQPLRTFESSISQDAFVVKLASSGAYQWHTFIGASVGYYISSGSNFLTIDKDDNLYVGGGGAILSGSEMVSYLGGENKNIPPLRPYNAETARWAIQKLNSNGYYQWHFYHGGKTGTSQAFYYFNSIVACRHVNCENSIVVTGSGNQYWEFEDTLNPIAPKNWISTTETTGQDITVVKFILYPEIKVTVSGAGTGLVASSPAGVDITYPGQTSANLVVDTNSPVVITAFANTGYVAYFNNTCQLAGGVASGENTDTVTCTLPNALLRKDISVVFAQGQLYTVTVNKGGNAEGSITANNCYFLWNGNTGTCSVYAGTSLTLTATPSTTSVAFEGFTGDVTGSSPVTFTVNSNKNINANFVNIRRTITVNMVGAIDWNQSVYVEGCAEYNYYTNTCYANLGSSVTVHASSMSSHIVFNGFTGDVTGTSPLTFTVDGNKNINANFVNIRRTITVNMVGAIDWNQSVYVEGCAEYNYYTNTCYANLGSSVTVHASSMSSHIVFNGFTGDVTGTSPLTFTVDGNKNINANFVNIRRTITVNMVGAIDWNQSVYVEGCAEYNYYTNTCYANLGSSVTVHASSMSSHIVFTGFTGDVSGTSPLTFTVDGNKIINANFAQFIINPKSLTFGNPGGTGSISITTSLSWTASSNSAWITISAGSSGTGNGTVSFTVANNSTGQMRTGTITINAGSITQTITVYQMNTIGKGMSYQWHRLDGSLSSYTEKPIGIMDSQGNVYVVASSYGFNSGDSGNNNIAPIVNAGANRYVVVIKYNKDGAYQWHTFVPGEIWSAFDRQIDIGSDGVYILASASGSVGSPTRAFSGSDDFVVTKLSQNGIYQWHTYLGGTGTDYPRGIAVDSNNNVYVVGSSTATWGSPIVNMNAGVTSAVIAKLNSNGVLQWNTFVNHTSSSSFQAVSVGADDNVYIGGSISGSQWGSPVNYKTNQDAVVFKYDGNGNRLWHTYFGSTSTGGVQAIAVDNTNNVYALINGSASWTGPSNEQPRRTYTNGSEYSVIKLSSSGSYLWHTFLGFGSYDSKNKLTVDRDGNIYIGGANTSYLGGETKDIPALRPFDDKSAKWGIQKIDSNGYYQWHFYHGGKVSSDSAYSNFYSIYACKYETCKNELVVTGGGSQYWEFIDTLNPSVPKNWISTTGTTSQDITVLKFLLYPELRVTVSGAGTGTVTSNPAGINITYPGQTSGSLLLETPATVVLTAQANPGYVANLNGTCQLAGGTVSGDNTSIVTCSLSSLSMRKDVAVLFTSGMQYPISVTKLGTGTGVITSNPTGLNCGSTCTANFGANEKITLFITPSPGSSVAQVKIGGIFLGPVNAVTIRGMNANHSLEVTFSSP